MNSNNTFSKETLAVHAGTIPDPTYQGTVSPIFPSSAYDYEDVPETFYPRYFNTPNQKSIIEKLAVLESAEDGLIFSSGMAAITTALFAFLRTGDHCIVPFDIYGGTQHAIVHEFARFQIGYTMVDMRNPAEVAAAIRPETKVIYLETPSNPTLAICDIQTIATIARDNHIHTIIDNTFASPVNQNPILLGIDVVTHSGTKYIGGHSDLSCGAVLGSKKVISQIFNSAIHFGGNLDAQACWLIERSLKTIFLRVRQQNANALAIARFLEKNTLVKKTYYPGLESHVGYDIARKQMPGGFGGMVAFEPALPAASFIENLNLIKRAISLGGVESTITSPIKTSHAKMDAETCARIGVTADLVRLSVGIEAEGDLIKDIQQALVAASK